MPHKGARTADSATDYPLVDGNKRTALLATETFLLDNGFELIAGDADTLTAMLDLAKGNLTENAFAAWLRKNIVPI